LFYTLSVIAFCSISYPHFSSIFNIFAISFNYQMASTGLKNFIDKLQNAGELKRITSYFNPLLEITEVTDRISKSGGPALLFENNGTIFPLLINTFGSDKRIAMAIGRENLDDAGKEIEKLFGRLTGIPGSFGAKLSGIPQLIKISGIMPSRSGRSGRCREVIHNDPDLDILPVLKCWPFDGGKFITLPIVHTYHPETGKSNAGMYRMQILDKKTTAMHWQMHKTGANHFQAWKKAGRKMPVSVVLGGDPVYTYSATAPLPENIDEYILAGFLRGKRVNLIKCLTNDIYVPEDADIVIEGYVDPSEEPVWEGPFGDHTGFYSLADWYPRFHVTCITHSRDAVYPATIVGIPPQEDTFLAKATEKIFLSPIKLTLQPEVEDLHMPDAGVAHNLVVVKIRKTYPGQGMKVINSLFGAGQMMFTKYLAVVSGDVDIRDYTKLLKEIFRNTDPSKDLLFCRGPLDVLDHSSDTFAFGGKLGIDATVKTDGESQGRMNLRMPVNSDCESIFGKMTEERILTGFNSEAINMGIPLIVVSVDNSDRRDKNGIIADRLRKEWMKGTVCLILVVDHKADVNNLFMVVWQMLGNSDPQRDHKLIDGSVLIMDGTIKFYRPGGFSRNWPNIVCASEETISSVDSKWEMAGLGSFVPSPTIIYKKLLNPGSDELI
jgi:4-hydroxy-3-polyprenylbenzoate decarboxylase